MKRIIPGIIAFFICWVLYAASSSMINNEIQYNYRKGYSDGYWKRSQKDDDSVRVEWISHRKSLDSLMVELIKIK
jgi:hypothetical protein